MGASGFLSLRAVGGVGLSTLVTGASGQLAAGVIDEVLKTVPASKIIVVTRTPERLTPLADIGVTVRQADFADPPTLSAALDGRPACS